jgi:hypothetical protein
VRRERLDTIADISHPQCRTAASSARTRLETRLSKAGLRKVDTVRREL